MTRSSIESCAREAAFRRFATIDPERSIRWNLQRLGWLVEQDVISPNEYFGFQQKLLPSLAESLLLKPIEIPDRRFEQHFFNSAFVFDFKADHLAYRRRTALGNEYAVNHRYLDLAEPTLDVQAAAPSQLVPQVILWLGLIALGYGTEMYGRLTRSALAAPDALQNILLALGPGIAGFAIAVIIVRRVLRVICTKLPSGVTILKNKQHDEIIAELRQRRGAALAALAKPDPLLSQAEQANRFTVLQNLHFLAAEAIPDLLMRAQALQVHLGLADLDPATGDAIAVEDFRERSESPKTLH